MAAIPPPAIPLPPRQHILDLGHSETTHFDHGHHATAWFNLGLHAQPALPTQAQFDSYCRRLLRHVRDPLVFSRCKPHTILRRCRVIVMAIKTISGMSRAHMNSSRPHLGFPLPGDMRRGTTWAAQMARLPAGAQLPLAAAVVAHVQSKSDVAKTARRQRALQYRQLQPSGGPSGRERAIAQERIREAEWEAANRYNGFSAIDGAGIVQILAPTATNRENDNSLWHALSQQVNGAGVTPASTDPRLGLRGGRREKAWLYHYFTAVLMNPAHIRHRLYTCLQQFSLSWRGENDQMRHQTPAWGELSILRCLAVNDPDGGVPKWPQFDGIFQLIADFWCVEVVVFLRERGLPRGPGVPMNGWRAMYNVRVFGKRQYNTAAGGFGQFLFVTDSDWQHFDAVEKVGPLGGPGGPGVFDTSNIDDHGRYRPMRMRFLEVAGTSPPTYRAPTDIPATNNGIAPGAPGYQSYRRPADDPQYRLADTHVLVECFENEHDAVELRPGFGNGRMPRLANMLTIGAWATEQGAPGVDTAPSAFEDWLMTSGRYRNPWLENRVFQGVYANKKMALIDRWTQEMAEDDVVRRTDLVG